MRIRFDIPPTRVQNLSQAGLAELSAQSERLTLEIVDEASRIEASRRHTNTNSEITAAIVIEAATIPQRYVPRKKTNDWINKTIQATACVSSMVAGSLLDIDKFKYYNNAIWFIVWFVIAIGSSFYLIFRSENNG